MGRETTTDLGRTLELAEAAAWNDYCASAPPAIRREVGAGARRFGSAVAMIAAKVDVLACNRVIGLGVEGAVSDATIDGIVDAYAEAGAHRFFVQLAPGSGELGPRLGRRGFTLHNHWMKLWRGVDPPQPVRSDLRVERVGVGRAETFGRLFVENFEWSESLVPWIAAPVGRPGWRHYLAFDGDRPVATGAMFVAGRTAWIDFASTRPDARGRGAQSALVVRRILDCRGLGVERMVVETAEPTEDHPAPSFRNMRRFGFEVAYRRPNWIRCLD